MREILFRGKRADNGEWVFGHYAELQNPLTESGKPVNYVICEGMGAFCTSVRPETVGQYTGLKDKNGVKIFEGDVIKHITGDEDDAYIGKVVFETTPPDALKKVRNWDTECGFLVTWFKSNAYKDLRRDLSWWALEGASEVIGNIYDNPELVNGGEDNDPV